MPVKGGRLLIEGKEPVGAHAERGRYAQRHPIQVTANGFYKLELQTESGEFIPGSLDYTIDVLDDRPADDHVREAGPRHEGHRRRGSVHAGAGDGRLRRLDRRPHVLGERWPARRRSRCTRVASAFARSCAGHTFFLEELQAQAGRPRVVLRPCARQRRQRSGSEDGHLLHERPSVRPDVQAVGAGRAAAVVAAAMIRASSPSGNVRS